MMNTASGQKEKELVLYIMTLLKNQASSIYSGVLDLSELPHPVRNFDEYSHEVKSLALCTKAVGGLVLEKIKDSQTNGSIFLHASDEIANNITDINDKIIKIKEIIDLDNHILN